MANLDRCATASRECTASRWTPERGTRHDRVAAAHAICGMTVGRHSGSQLLLGHAQLADLPFERNEDPQVVESAAPGPGQELQLPRKLAEG